MTLGSPSAGARFGLAGIAGILWFGQAAQPAGAIPVFAHRFGLTCQACHTVVPQLSAFGEAFAERGYRLPEAQPRPVFPVAVKLNLQYASEAEGPLPKAVVDEIELLAGGAIAKRGSYFAEQYVVDGGLPGRSRDLWAAWRIGPDAESGMLLRAGQFTLPLPIDPETFRETTGHYAVWDQTAGENPFTFFAPKIGLALEADAESGLGGALAVVRGREPQSGNGGHAIDRHLFVRYAAGSVTLSAYRYDGVRRLAADEDRFWREGIGISSAAHRLRADVVYQHGFDGRATAAGALRSSGAFAQVRYEFSPRLFTIARYDATQDTAFARSLIAGAGYRLARNARLSVFGTVGRDAETGASRNTLSTALLFAY